MKLSIRNAPPTVFQKQRARSYYLIILPPHILTSYLSYYITYHIMAKSMGFNGFQLKQSIRNAPPTVFQKQRARSYYLIILTPHIMTYHPISYHGKVNGFQWVSIEVEHKKSSSDGLSKTKIKVILPHQITTHIITYHPISYHISYHGKVNGFQWVSIEAEHKKRSSDVLSKTKSKALLPRFTSHLDTSRSYCLIKVI